MKENLDKLKELTEEVKVLEFDKTELECMRSLLKKINELEREKQYDK